VVIIIVNVGCLRLGNSSPPLFPPTLLPTVSRDALTIEIHSAQ
jgi:hypothetical protein